MHLIGFIIKKFVTMHGHMNVKKKLTVIDWRCHFRYRNIATTTAVTIFSFFL